MVRVEVSMGRFSGGIQLVMLYEGVLKSREDVFQVT